MEQERIDWRQIERELWLLRERVTAQQQAEALPIGETLGYTPEVWTNHVCRAILRTAIGYQGVQDIIMAGDPFAGPVPAFLLPEEQAKEDAMTRQLQEVLGDDIEIAPPTDGELAKDGSLWHKRSGTAFEAWVMVHYSPLVQEMGGLARRLLRYTAETRLPIGRERKGLDVWDVLQRQGFDAMYQRIRAYLERPPRR
jgi:hypothetical protein